MLAVAGVFLLIAGVALPLADPDLSSHLAVGEWIVTHHQLPTIEPFAWTRAGAPYFAYSWLPEVAFYVILREFGPWGLSALNGFLFAAVPASVVALGRAAGWRAWPTLVLAACNLGVSLQFTPWLRPQVLLLSLVPVVWALLYHGRVATRAWPAAAGLLVAGSIASNSHFLWPLTGAPLALLVTEPVERRRALTLAGGLLIGWALSPHLFDWPAIWNLNLAPNPLLPTPSPISEFQPGFANALAKPWGPSVPAAILVTILPWLLQPRGLSRMQRAIFGAYWCGGIVMFATSTRALVVPWLTTLPLAARAIGTISLRWWVISVAGRFAVVLLAVVVAANAIKLRIVPGAGAGDVHTRYLPGVTGRALEPIANLLQSKVSPTAHGRVLTTFSLGSAIEWRLPRFSPSIDGRTIFPDSVALPEAYHKPTQGPRRLPPWRSAEVAIVERRYEWAAVFDTASGWRHLGDAPGPFGTVGLWAREDWLSRFALPQTSGTRPRLANPLPSLPY